MGAEMIVLHFTAAALIDFLFYRDMDSGLCCRCESDRGEAVGVNITGNGEGPRPGSRCSMKQGFDLLSSFVNALGYTIQPSPALEKKIYSRPAMHTSTIVIPSMHGDTPTPGGGSAAG